ncbi:hypothetical protein AMECASPLE_020107, partial [Ameca splendens]
HLVQLLWGKPKAFPGQPRYIVPPACPGLSPGSPPGETCLEQLLWEVTPPKVEEQRLYSELLTDGQALQPISKGVPGLPGEEAHSAACIRDEVLSVMCLGNKPVILVVMHHTFNPNLVIAGSRNQVQDPNVHLTVDYCFFEHELLNCNRNKISWHEIQKFLRVSISRTWLQTLIEGVKENALTVTLFIVAVACITFVVTCIVLAEKVH